MMELQFTIGYALALLKVWLTVHLVADLAREVRRAHRLVTQQSRGRHTAQALAAKTEDAQPKPAKPTERRGSHRGRYALKADIAGSLSGHGIGWGVHAAL